MLEIFDPCWCSSRVKYSHAETDASRPIPTPTLSNLEDRSCGDLLLLTMKQRYFAIGLAFYWGASSTAYSMLVVLKACVHPYGHQHMHNASKCNAEVSGSYHR